MIARNSIKLEILDSANGATLYKATQDGRLWYETEKRNGEITQFEYLTNAIEHFSEISHGEELKTGAF